MKRLLLYIVTLIFGLSALAQSVDSHFVLPTFTLQKRPLLFKPYITLSFNTDTLNLFSPFSVKKSFLTDIKRDNSIQPSIVVKKSPQNLITPNFTAPHIQSMNWWQAIGVVGMGLTRGLVFDNYNSNYTLDD